MLLRKKKKKEKVLVAMSGGVDSSVAAAILHEQGFEVIGIFMHFWAEPGVETEYGEKNKCCSLESFNDARRVAQKFGFPIYTINLDEEFKDKIVDDFLTVYAKGKTPNPCVTCNKFIKFDAMLQKADALGIKYIVTGHYAKIKKKDGLLELWRPHDKEKDQTYFLYTLTQDKLSRLMFPLSGFTKQQVRNMATRYGLEVASKRESQEICFIPEKSHNEFLKRHLDLVPGDIMDLNGNLLGKHAGLPLYTLGQRRGIEIGGTGPYYAAKFDYEKNILYVTSSLEDPILFKPSFSLTSVNWISGKAPKFPFDCEIVVRYRHQAVLAQIEQIDGRILVNLSQPERAITSGQSAVMYLKGRVLGGGIIV
ncbi:MAG: tRNA 2-thiouridine(34) synthase MnmA [bacterium]